MDDTYEVEWETARNWIEEHTTWDRDDPSPDIVAAGMTALEAFGEAELVEVAREQSVQQARAEWADSGVDRLCLGISKIARKRCQAAKAAVETSLRDASQRSYYRVERNERECARSVQKWWKLNFKLHELLDLLPPDVQPRMKASMELVEFSAALLDKSVPDNPPVEEELEVPQSWEDRTPKPERDAEKLFDGLTREAKRGEPNVLEEVKEWVDDAYQWYRRGRGYSAEEAKDEILRIAESHDYHFDRRNIDRWKTPEIFYDKK